MSFDYSKLRGKIREKYGTQGLFADELGISAATLSDKLNEKSDFSHGEITLACDRLGIPYERINEYFFCVKR